MTVQESKVNEAQKALSEECWLSTIGSEPATLLMHPLCHAFLSPSNEGRISHRAGPTPGTLHCSFCGIQSLYHILPHFTQSPLTITSMTCIETLPSLLHPQTKKLCERGKCLQGKILPIFLARSDLPEVLCRSHTTFLRKGAQSILFQSYRTSKYFRYR